MTTLSPNADRVLPTRKEVWPRWAHVPGTGTAPDRAPLEAAKVSVRRPVAAEAWESDAAYRYGAALYEGGFFWEAHEVWEAVWMACAPNGAERRVLRGLIQLANAALKIRMDRPKAAIRLLTDANDLLREASASNGSAVLMGIALGPLRAAAEELARGLEQGPSTEASLHKILSPLREAATMLDQKCTIMHATKSRPAS